MQEIQAVDAGAVFQILGLFGVSAELNGSEIFAEKGVSIRIVKFCASLWPALLTLGALSFFISRLIGVRRASQYTAVIVPTCVVVVLNWGRLSLMTVNRETYDWFHDGGGAECFRLLVLLCIVVPAFIVHLRAWTKKGVTVRVPRS